jgi:hypothetical protein
MGTKTHVGSLTCVADTSNRVGKEFGRLGDVPDEQDDGHDEDRDEHDGIDDESVASGVRV